MTAALKQVLQRPSGGLDLLLVLLCPDPNQLYDLNDERKVKHASFMRPSVIPIKLQPTQKKKKEKKQLSQKHKFLMSSFRIPCVHYQILVNIM